jgi:hypothetical protein
MRLCKAITKAGKPCPSPALTGKRLCIMHSGRARELGRKGGLRRTVFNPEGLKELDVPTSAQDLAHFVATCMDEVRKGKLTPGIANCLGQLGMVFLKAVEQCELRAIQLELEALRNRLGVRSNAVQ